MKAYDSAEYVDKYLDGMEEWYRHVAVLTLRVGLGIGYVIGFVAGIGLGALLWR